MPAARARIRRARCAAAPCRRRRRPQPPDAADRPPAAPRRRAGRAEPEPPTASAPQFRRSAPTQPATTFVRKATLGRLRRRSRRSAAATTSSSVRGLRHRAACRRAELFGARQGSAAARPLRAARRREAVADAWTQAAKIGGSPSDEVCVLLMGPARGAGAASSRGAIAEQRRKPRGAKADADPGRCARLGRAHAARRAGHRQDAARAAQNRVIIGSGTLALCGLRQTS